MQASTVGRALEALMHRINAATYPFVCPQYCRRRSLNYTNPCLVRLGVRVISTESGQSCTITNFHPASQTPTFATVHPSASSDGRAAHAAESLLPYAGELWMPFDHFPEMVCGERCVLNNSC